MTRFSAVVLVLVVLVLIVLLLLWRRRRLRNRRRRVPDGLEDLVEKVARTFARASPELAESSLQRALPQFLRASSERPNFSRRLLFIGPAGSGKTPLLTQLSRSDRYAATVKEGDDWPCQLFKVGTGLGIELSGRVLTEDNAKGKGGEAFQFALRKLKGLHPTCPIDGVVLTLSCQRQLLAEESGDSEEFALTLRKRLDNIREYFGIRAPVYVLLTECEALPGFTQYCKRIGERRHQILGWSNPDSSATDEPPDWVSQALQCITTELTHEQIHRLSVEAPAAESDEYFVFPAMLAGCERTLRTYVKEIFSERSAEAPQLRGIYFAGESGESPDAGGRSSVELGQTDLSGAASTAVASHGPAPVGASGAVAAASLRAPSDAPVSRCPLLQPARLRGGVGVGSISFVTDLFNGLILEESDIAEPTERAIQERNTSIIRWRIAVLVLCAIYVVALIWESTVISGRCATLLRPLQQIRTGLDERTVLFSNTPGLRLSAATHSETATRTAEREYQMRQLAANLLDELTKVTAGRFCLITAPWTCFWPTHSRVTSALGVGHQRIVLPTLRHLLHSKSSLSARVDERPSERDQKLEETNEFSAATDWIQHLERLELSIKEFNCLIDASGDKCNPADNLRSIMDLSRSLLDHELNPSFLRGMGEFAGAFVYRGGVETTGAQTRIDIKDLAPQRKDKTVTLLEALNQRAFELVSQPAQGEIKMLSTATDALASSSQTALKVSHLRDISNAIGTLTTDLKDRKVSWIASSRILSSEEGPAVSQFDPQLQLTQTLDLLTPVGEYEAYRSLLVRLSRIEFVNGRELAQKSASGLVASLAKMRSEWRELKFAQRFNLLKRDRDKDPPKMELPSDTAALKKPVDVLLSKQFMKEDPAATPASLDFKNVRLRWDVDPLKSAVRLIKEYEEWLQEGSLAKDLPLEYQQKPRELAQAMVSDATLRLVAQAAHVEAIVSAISPPEDVLKSDTDSLAAANASLIEILSGLRRLRLEDSRRKIHEALIAQGDYLLGVLGSSLRDAQLYAANFKNWNDKNWNDKINSKPLAFRVFDAADAAQLDDYLVKERTTRAVKYVGDFAEPVVTLLLSPEVNYQSRGADSDANLWFRNVRAVRGYASKQAGNSLVELERFIGTDLAGIRSHHDCTKYLAAAAGEPTTINLANKSGKSEETRVTHVSTEDDFFSRRRFNLLKELKEVCGTKSSGEYQQRYKDLQGDFQNQLSNRFPFATGINAEDAEPTEVRALLSSAHVLWSDYKDTLINSAEPDLEKQRECLSQLDAVYNFMTSLWPHTESAEGFLNVKVQFRTNREHEVAGNQIVDWSLQLGEARLRLGEKKTSEHWFLKDTVRASFRWAKDGPTVPSRSPAFQVDGFTATTTHEGYWALLRLIAAHRVRSSDLGVQSEKAVLLRFLIPTHNNEEGGLLNLMEGANAQLYVALTFGEKDAPISYPNFPSFCPPPEDRRSSSNSTYETASTHSASR